MRVSNSPTYSLAFHGPPGCGKTHFVKNALSKALDRPMVSIPLGGATDASFLIGMNYTYEGSKEGRLATALMEAGCCDPIIYFDEVDKISQTERGSEIENILIHLIDPTTPQFRDRYFHGIDLDFSKCTFVFSYNDASKINPVLLDRMKHIKLDPPSRSEMEDIINEHLIPRICNKLLNPIDLSTESIQFILDRVQPGSGMRGVDKDLEHVIMSAQLDYIMRGETSEDTFDKNGKVSKSFVETCLKSLTRTL